MLHAIYRSTGKVNTKPRPAGFSKRRSLESFLSAWEASPDTGELIFLDDGTVPEDQLELMEAAGRVVVRAASDAMGAYVSALELALGQGWPDGDLVYFGEDDYLYRPQTFAALVAAARNSRRWTTSRRTRRSATRCPTASRCTTGCAARGCTARC